MSTTELTDNLTFLSALQMLRQLTQQGLLTDNEGPLPAGSWSESSGPLCFCPDFFRAANCPILGPASRCYSQMALL